MKKAFFAILCTLSLLAGCMELPDEETTVFVPPTEEEVVCTDESTATEEKPLPEEYYFFDRLFQLESAGAGRDDYGKFFYFGQYGDGDDVIELELHSRKYYGNYNKIDGAGLLLFVDGYPQPYFTETDESISYLHIFNLQSSDPETILFTPNYEYGSFHSTPELVWFHINDPYAFPSEIKDAVSLHTSGSKGNTSRILMCKAAEPMPLPPSRYAITNSRCRTERMENDGNVNWSFTVNGEINVFLDGISADTPLELRAECWGAEAAELTVVVFVDNEPVEGIWEVTLMQGQKTCLTGELLLHDFDGSAAIYAMLVPRNTTDPKFDYITFCPLASNTYYLVDELPE